MMLKQFIATVAKLSENQMCSIRVAYSSMQLFSHAGGAYPRPQTSLYQSVILLNNDVTHNWQAGLEGRWRGERAIGVRLHPSSH